MSCYFPTDNSFLAASQACECIVWSHIMPNECRVGEALFLSSVGFTDLHFYTALLCLVFAFLLAWRVFFLSQWMSRVAMKMKNGITIDEQKDERPGAVYGWPAIILADRNINTKRKKRRKHIFLGIVMFASILVHFFMVKSSLIL